MRVLMMRMSVRFVLVLRGVVPQVVVVMGGALWLLHRLVDSPSILFTASKLLDLRWSSK